MEKKYRMDPIIIELVDIQVFIGCWWKTTSWEDLYEKV